MTPRRHPRRRLGWMLILLLVLSPAAYAADGMEASPWSLLETIWSLFTEWLGPNTAPTDFPPIDPPSDSMGFEIEPNG